MDKQIKPGDLIQLDTWFGDIWSEVLEAYDNMVVHCCYSKHGDQRWTMLTFKDKIRRVTTRDKVPDHHVRHLAEGKVGGLHSKAWPDKLRPTDRAHPNYPQRYPDCPTIEAHN